ncbi:MAG: hypothetical protein KME50_06565 [Nostoc desertorum CM1-VF14]|nr:hypothetical protein [Nostoc desertorum CM1-VF14]
MTEFKATLSSLAKISFVQFPCAPYCPPRSQKFDHPNTHGGVRFYFLLLNIRQPKKREKAIA